MPLSLPPWLDRSKGVSRYPYYGSRSFPVYGRIRVRSERFISLTIIE